MVPFLLLFSKSWSVIMFDLYSSFILLMYLSQQSRWLCHIFKLCFSTLLICFNFLGSLLLWSYHRFFAIFVLLIWFLGFIYLLMLYNIVIFATYEYFVTWPWYFWLFHFVSDKSLSFFHECFYSFYYWSTSNISNNTTFNKSAIHLRFQSSLKRREVVLSCEVELYVCRYCHR